MRVLVGVPDLFVLAGNVRVSLELADMMKELGHKVVVLYSNIRGESEQYFKLNEIGSYYPIRNLDLSDFERVSWGNYYIEILARLGLYEPKPHYDVFLTNYDSLAYVNEDVDLPEIFYVNWPDRPGTPSCEVWANSKYTQKRVLKRWGISAVVVNPPIKIEHYNSSPSFKERDIDVIGFGQLYPMKRFQNLSPLHEKGYKTYVIGADVKQGRPDVTKVVASPNFGEVTHLLSRSKVFVHSRVGEHFGIAVIEAMASGCATICHRSGGPLSDIILDEKYGLLFNTKDELIEKVDYLLSDENIWKRYSDLAVERAKRFSYDKIKKQVRELLSNKHKYHI